MTRASDDAWPGSRETDGERPVAGGAVDATSAVTPKLALPPSSRLERLAVLLLVLAALVPRLRDVARPFDRESEGWQGAFFTLAAINYERLGAFAAGGYPILNIDLGSRADAQRRVWDHPEHWLVYDNHPPLVAWMAWKSLDAFAPEDWNSAWHEGRAASGLEFSARLPFVLAHVAALVALWWALRQSLGARPALIGLGLAATTPVLALYATLINYENPALACVLLGVGCYARWTKSGARRDAWCMAGAFALGGCVTWAPLFFAGALAVHAALSRTLARAWKPVGGALLACALPLAAHAAWAQHVAARLGRPAHAPLARARELWAPLFDGSHPLGEWLGLQTQRSLEWLTLPLLVCALAGLVVALRRIRSTACNIAWPLALGGAAYLFAFYRHTLEPQHSFLMFVAPAVLAFAALALDALAPLLERLRAGIAPLVVVTSTVALFGLQHTNALRYEMRGRDASESSSGAPAPELPLPDETGAELAALVPSGAFVLHPSALGLNLAVNLYAWRSLWPIAGADDTSADAVARQVGLEQAPRWLVLPNAPPPSARAQCDELRAQLAHDRTPDASGPRWSAWHLR